ncbi:cytochrome c oxidase subunit 7B, mitochondrial-like [Canis lupus familiaris]|uniref:cytochrome c oxidase subunit 7B, mitochondrial-like n=1 Tax=Canis lupus familiaris TaxID=9615 RepID=UPI00022568DC|nr:cytochrome c oxidase subunit 7B, mitochondrial-like [Canis lupus familiaris]XP_038509527.1 cytochrome c oxidase subunit 7B, mitochondrial-like [Canis lupus familiaris]
MFPMARKAQNLPEFKAFHKQWQGSHQKWAPDFHDKYGNVVLASGATFSIAVWAYTATQIGIEWNLFPVGRVTPKGMEGSVIPAGVIMNCFKTNS